MCPVHLGGETLAVVELSRPAVTKNPFDESDEDTANSYLTWGEIALHYSDAQKKYSKQKNLAGFLLKVVRYKRKLCDIS